MRASSAAIRLGGRTKSTAPAEIALIGMAGHSAVLGSCAKVTPPSALISLSPTVPSDPLPERITPMAALPFPRQSGIKFVDRMVRSRSPLARNKLQCAAPDDHALVGRDYIYVVRLHRDSVGNLEDRHSGRFGEKLRQRTGVLGVEMLDQNEGEPGVRGQGLQ